MKRSAWLAALGLFLIGALVGSVVMALAFPGVDRSPISHSTQAIAVTATVEQRPVRTPAVVSATVRAPVGAALAPNASSGTPGGSGREVISRKTRKVGDTLHYGDLVAEVSGRPVFAMPPHMPLYRDIEPGMSGRDVAALQKLLADRGYFWSTTNGEFGASTLDALKRFFHAAGYDLPELGSGRRGLALADTTTVPRDRVRVTKAAVVGTVLGEPARDPASSTSGGDAGTGPAGPATPVSMVEVEVSPAAVTARVDLLQAEAFTAGGPVTVRVGSSATAPSTVESVSEFQEAESSLPAGYDIVIRLPKRLAADAKANDAATITEVADHLPTAPAVPLVSVRQDASGPYVMLAGPEDPATGARRVPVTVRGQSEGYALLEESPDLPDGAVVLVNGAT